MSAASKNKKAVKKKPDARPSAARAATPPRKATSPGSSSPAKPTADARPGDRVTSAEFSGGAQSDGHFPPPVTVEIAFAGRSNVGKSSLMNRLLERRSLVRTSSTPGCTRQVSWFDVQADDGAHLTLVDLPGYGYARRSKTERKAWGDLIDRYLLERPTLRGVVVLTDVRRGFEEDDLELLKMLASPSRTSRPPLQVVLVATKLDKLPRAQHKPRLDELSRQVGTRVMGFSSTDGTGRLPLWRRLRRIAGVEPEPELEPTPPSTPST